jgi:hypothetical protein
MGVASKIGLLSGLVALGLGAVGSAAAWAPTCSIEGTAGRDVLVGTPTADVICGAGGNDIIRGRGGRDALYGGGGADTLSGGRGADALYGGLGEDRLYGRSGVDLFLSFDGVGDRVDGGGSSDRARVDSSDRWASVERRYPARPSAPTLLAAGDIGDCRNRRRGAWRTAALLDLFPYATVAALGDTVYPEWPSSQFSNCYEPTWGRAKARTWPAVGNHEYVTPEAAGYFDYFGARAGARDKGYYSYDLGSWHVVVLNTNRMAPDDPDCLIVSCAAGSVQERWLRNDLAASAATCTLAYWHHPRFSSISRNYPALDAIWNDLQAHGVDLVLNGHGHHYERFAPQRPDGTADANGITEFIVGTGGAKLDESPPNAIPNPHTVVARQEVLGVLRVTLRATGYEWEFVPVAGESFSDSGSASCHE